MDHGASNSAAAYHMELSAISAAYTTYAATRQDLWRNPNFQQARARLGHASDYARHYVEYLLPMLRHGCPQDPSCDSTVRCVAKPRRFLDLGCAPGGLCEALLHRSVNPADPQWTGVGVTLAAADGGLAMEVADVPNRFEVRYADVTDRELFVRRCVPPSEEGTYDFVNCGIVLDQTVRQKRQSSSSDGATPQVPLVSFGEQLYTQLLVAAAALRRDGKGVVMMALKTDFPSLPEVMPTLRMLIDNVSGGALNVGGGEVRIIPTMYTTTCGKKQFYVVVLGCNATIKLAEGIRGIWNRGTARYLALKRAAIATKRARAEDAAEPNPTATKRLDSVQDLVDAKHGDTAELSTTNGLGARETVSCVYRATATGKDLDTFFSMVSNALGSQASRQGEYR